MPTSVPVRANFVKELPEQDVLQFQQLSQKFGDGKVCWCYNPRAENALLASDSAYSKCVKGGMVSGCLDTAFKKSCCYRIVDSFNAHLSRLKDADYPDFLFLRAVCTNGT